MIGGHRLSLLFLFLEWLACFVFSGKFQRHFGEDPAMAQFHFSAIFRPFFLSPACLLVAGLFYVSCISMSLQRCSEEVLFFRRNLSVNHVFVVCCW
jgi:hypothetical protein